ncbi:MAG: DUF1700 domain-containing protein [Blautia sp.]|nr:DUF1700 domain-containing protein [Blautia sp.]
MDRAQFLERLEILLSDVSKTEREEALEYYENYFDDAGAENEEAVLRDLGSPESVAATIKANLSESDKAFGEYTDRGYEDYRTLEERQVPEVAEGKTFRDRIRKNPNSLLILVIIALVFLSPVLGAAKGIVQAVIGILIVLPVLPLALVIAFGGAGIGLIAGGVGLAIGGMFSFGTAGRLLAAGGGCIMTAAGILLVIFAVYIGKRMIPAYLRRLVDFGQELFRRFRKEGEHK